MKPCSFERIYFSRGSDVDIYRERKTLGEELVPSILEAIGNDIDNTVFSFIPNTAEVAFYGMVKGLNDYLNHLKAQDIERLGHAPTPEDLQRILSRRIRSEKVAIKDIKLRTFITEDASRNDLAAHVYDITYGSLRPGQDNLVIIDDSIVRGTTLKQSIIGILDRLGPKKIVIVSSSPQVRYPDYYGIDMSMVNYVKEIYAPFSDEEVADMMAGLLVPEGTRAEVQLVFQPVEGLRQACPNHPGDWYFTGDYPTPGGVRLLNEAFLDYIEKIYHPTGEA